VTQAHPPRALLLADDEEGDQIAGDDEEHLHTEEPAPEPGVVGVIHHHRDHGEGAHAVEPRQVGHTADLAAERGMGERPGDRFG